MRTLKMAASSEAYGPVDVKKIPAAGPDTMALTFGPRSLTSATVCVAPRPGMDVLEHMYDVAIGRAVTGVAVGSPGRCAYCRLDMPSDADPIPVVTYRDEATGKWVASEEVCDVACFAARVRELSQRDVAVASTAIEYAQSAGFASEYIGATPAPDWRLIRGAGGFGTLTPEEYRALKSKGPAVTAVTSPAVAVFPIAVAVHGVPESTLGDTATHAAPDMDPREPFDEEGSLLHEELAATRLAASEAEAITFSELEDESRRRAKRRRTGGVAAGGKPKFDLMSF